MNWMLLWGSRESVTDIKALVTLIEQAQQQLRPGQEGDVARTDDSSHAVCELVRGLGASLTV